MVHSMPFKNVSEQSYKVKLKTFGASLVRRLQVLFTTYIFVYDKENNNLKGLLTCFVVRK